MKNLRPLNKREKILAGLVGAALFILSINGFIKFRLNQIRELDQSIANEQQQLDANRAIFEKLSSRKLASASFDSSIDLKSYVDGNSRLGNILSNISEMEHDQKLFKLTKISSENKESAPGVEKILFSMEIETSFLGLGTFLEKLENSKYLSRVESVTVNRVGTDLKKCSATVKFYSYILRDS